MLCCTRSVVWEVINCLVQGCGDVYVNRQAPDSWPGPWGAVKMLPDRYTCQLLRETHRHSSERQTRRYFEENGAGAPLWSFFSSYLALCLLLAFPAYGRSCYSDKHTRGHSTVCMSTQTPPWAIIHWILIGSSTVIISGSSSIVFAEICNRTRCYYDFKRRLKGGRRQKTLGEADCFSPSSGCIALVYIYDLLHHRSRTTCTSLEGVNGQQCEDDVAVLTDSDISVSIIIYPETKASY